MTQASKLGILCDDVQQLTSDFLSQERPKLLLGSFFSSPFSRATQLLFLSSRSRTSVRVEGPCFSDFSRSPIPTQDFRVWVSTCFELTRWNELRKASPAGAKELSPARKRWVKWKLRSSPFQGRHGSHTDSSVRVEGPCFPGSFRSLVKSLDPAGISRRQREVLDLLLGNLSNKEIAGKLFVCERTVKFHLSNLLSKFGVQRPTKHETGQPGWLPFRILSLCVSLDRRLYAAATSSLLLLRAGSRRIRTDYRIGRNWRLLDHVLVPAGFALGATVFALGSTGFMSGAVFAFGSTVFTLGVTVFAFGATGFALGVTGLALGVTGLALGTGLALAATGLALGIGLAAGAVGLALAAGLALGAAPRWAKHTPVSKPSIMPPTISFLMPFCLRSEGRMSSLKVRGSSESMFDFR